MILKKIGRRLNFDYERLEIGNPSSGRNLGFGDIIDHSVWIYRSNGLVVIF